MKLPLGSQVAAVNSPFGDVSRCLLTPPGCADVKEFPSILYNATAAKESSSRRRDLIYLYELQKTNEWITAIFYTIAFYILIFYRDTCIL